MEAEAEGNTNEDLPVTVDDKQTMEADAEGNTNGNEDLPACMKYDNENIETQLMDTQEGMQICDRVRLIFQGYNSTFLFRRS